MSWVLMVWPSSLYRFWSPLIANPSFLPQECPPVVVGDKVSETRWSLAAGCTRNHCVKGCGGLGRAQNKVVVGDGAAWIWNLAHDRWQGVTELLDFYHASEHLWGLGQAFHGEDEAATARWAKPLHHQLPHGGEEKVLDSIAALKTLTGEAGQVVAREQNYFASHAGRMNYRTLHRRGWPIGFGTVESACRQKQCRFKRPGQFWNPKGMRHLNALTN